MRDEPLTPAQRVAWAIDRSGETLEQLAEHVGCTHATLSQWRSGSTTLENAKASLLMAFAERTGVGMRWLLTGQGPAVESYQVTHHPLVVKASELVRTDSARADTAMRVLDALFTGEDGGASR